MASDKKVILGFSAGEQHWMESYFLVGVADMTAAQTFTEAMVKQRLKLAANGVKLLGVRISEFPEHGSVRMLRPNQNLWTNPPAVGGAPAATDVERASTVVLLSTVGQNGSRPERPLSGCPDTLHSETATDGLRPDLVPNWLTEFSKWRAILLNQIGNSARGPWGFAALVAAGAGNSDDILSGDTDPTTGELRVYVDGDKRTRYAVGTDVNVKKNRRISAIFTGPNGEWVVKAVALNAAGDQTIVTLQGATGIDPARWLPGSYGVIVVRSFVVTNFVDVAIVRGSTRKRFTAGFSRQPGRSPSQVTITT